MKPSFWTAVGAVLGFLGVALGAFGAHGLKPRLSAYSLEIFHTAVQYHMTHALALVAVGIWAAQNPGARAAVPGWSFLVGILIFSGSLYALALTEIRILGAITPIGGLAFLLGWIAFAILALKR